MCQMCAEYEADLRRMGLIEEADKVRAERHPEQKPVAPDKSAPAKSSGTNGLRP